MNDFQKKLQSLVSEFERAGRKVYSSEKLSRLDIDVLEDKIKRMYDFLISSDFDQIEKVVEQIKVEEIPAEKIAAEVKVEETVVEEKPAQTEIAVEEVAVEKEQIQLVVETPKQEEIIIPEVKQEEKTLEEPIIETPQTVIEPIVKEKEIAEPVQTEIVGKEEPKTEAEPTKETANTTITEPKVEKEEPKPARSSVLSYLHNNIMKDGEEKPKQEPTTLDLFSEKPTSIAERFENRTRSDLRTAIGVSEKFLFINDLFSGNLKEYTDFINQLNDLTSWDMSKLVIEETKQKRKWASSSLAYTTLEDLIHRRFTK